MLASFDTSSTERLPSSSRIHFCPITSWFSVRICLATRKVFSLLSLTRWLPTTSILVVIRRNLPIPIKMQLFDVLMHFYCIFGIYIEFWTFWKKKRASLLIPKTRFFKCFKGLASENPLAVNVLTLATFFFSHFS